MGVSFYEIYCEKAYDLLNDREECPIRVDGKEQTNVVNLTENIVPDAPSLMSLVRAGLSERVTSKNS